MDLVSSWERKGIEQGMQQGMHAGKEDIVVRILRKRFGAISPEVIQRLDLLSDDHLNELGEAQVDFTSLGDLESWLSRHQSN